MPLQFFDNTQLKFLLPARLSISLLDSKENAFFHLNPSAQLNILISKQKAL